MSPAPQPPRPGQPGKPGQGGKPGPAPGKPPAPAGRPGGRPPAQPEHPAEKEDSSVVPRAGKYVEVRKGRSGSQDAIKDDDEAPPITNVALPRSITQEQEQADLKARLGREELPDIDKRNALVKVKDTASEPTSLRRRSNGLWLLVLVALIAVAAIIADKMHLLDKLKGH